MAGWSVPRFPATAARPCRSPVWTIPVVPWVLQGHRTIDIAIPFYTGYCNRHDSSAALILYRLISVDVSYLFWPCEHSKFVESIENTFSGQMVLITIDSTMEWGTRWYQFETPLLLTSFLAGFVPRSYRLCTTLQLTYQSWRVVQENRACRPFCTHLYHFVPMRNPRQSGDRRSEWTNNGILPEKNTALWQKSGTRH